MSLTSFLFIFFLFSVIFYQYIVYKYEIEKIKKELKKHDTLTSNKLKRNIEYQLDFEEHIKNKELDILFYNFRKLNSEQQDTFLKIYRFIDTIPKEKRSWAYSQIMRTLNKG